MDVSVSEVMQTDKAFVESIQTVDVGFRAPVNPADKADSRPPHDMGAL